MIFTNIPQNSLAKKISLKVCPGEPCLNAWATLAGIGVVGRPIKRLSWRVSSNSAPSRRRRCWRPAGRCAPAAQRPAAPPDGRQCHGGRGVATLSVQSTGSRARAQMTSAFEVSPGLGLRSVLRTSRHGRRQRWWGPGSGGTENAAQRSLCSTPLPTKAGTSRLCKLPASTRPARRSQSQRRSVPCRC